MVKNSGTRFFVFTMLLAAVFFITFTAGWTVSPVAALNSQSVTGTLTAPVPTPTATTEPDYSLTILHTNDIHAHHAPNADGDGGAALAASVIRQIRSANPHTLLLNAGDNFTGTLFYVMHHGIDSAKLMNAMKYDAMTLGNHEFDEGDGNLALFIDQLKFPVIASNANFDNSTALKNKTVPYFILEKDGEKVGLIGLLNPETPSMSRPGSDLVFESNLAQAVQTNVDKLTALGINKIIVMSHIGYDADLKLARTIKGVDIIVGGHSHTLLAKFDNRAAGSYPAEVKDADGKTILVVQAGEYLQYIGKLDVTFNARGEIKQWSGDTVYLSHFITPDPQVKAMVDQLNVPIQTLTKKVIGESAVDLDGDRKVCRTRECTMGNLITDAMRSETGAQVALENGGGIRASINKGQVSMGDVLTVLPFGNLVSTFKLKGSDLRLTLENGVSQVTEGAGRFLQVSGVHYSFDASLPAGKRIVSAEVLDSKGVYQPLDDNATYTIATNDFMRGGGDGYTVLAIGAIDPYDYGRPLDQVLADYIKAHSPVSAKEEGRITTK